MFCLYGMGSVVVLQGLINNWYIMFCLYRMSLYSNSAACVLSIKMSSLSKVFFIKWVLQCSLQIWCAWHKFCSLQRTKSVLYQMSSLVFFIKFDKEHNLSRGLGWRIHGGVEDTKLSTNKQHSLSLITNTFIKFDKEHNLITNTRERVLYQIVFFIKWVL